MEPEFTWDLFVDGASSSARNGARILSKGPDGINVCYALRFDFLASNNMAKHKALTNDMQIATQVAVKTLKSTTILNWS